MPANLESLIERVMGELHRIVRTETVVGEPVNAGGLTLIPVSKISFGFGAGGGKEDQAKGGAGGGATVEPIAFVVIDAEGKASIMTLNEKEANWGQLVELMPDALAKIKRFVGRNKAAPSPDDTDDNNNDETKENNAE
jgi:uncharacterized spore protein YtfJ